MAICYTFRIVQIESENLVPGLIPEISDTVVNIGNDNKLIELLQN